jgi:hypothetical protein
MVWARVVLPLPGGPINVWQTISVAMGENTGGELSLFYGVGHWLLYGLVRLSIEV